MSVMLRDETDADAVAAIDANLRAYWAERRRTSGVDGRDDAKFLWLSANAPHWFFNAVMRAILTEATSDAGVAEAVAWYTARDQPMFGWWVGPLTRPAEFGPVLERHGFTLAHRLPGMTIALAGLPAAIPTPSDLTIEIADNWTTLGEWASVVADVYGLPDGAISLLMTMDGALGIGSDRPMRHHLARLHGQPVAAASSFVGAGVVGLYGVAARAAVRGQGIGAAVTLAALLDARERGYHVGILHASRMGAPVYRRLGFRDRCMNDLYLRHV